MKISKNSIWDKFYVFPSGYKHEMTDICTYIRGVIGGIFLAILFVTMGSAAIFMALWPYFVGVMTLITGYFYPEFGGDLLMFTLSSLIQIIILFYFSGVALVTLIKKHVFKLNTEKHLSPIVIQYRAFKEKTCILVERE